MNDIDKLFFELIRVAIGNAVCLSHTPTNAEWMQLYELAKKQSLVGICFAGVQRLQGQKQSPPEMLYLQWMGMAAKIQQRNEVLNRQCAELQAKLSDCGMRSSILKGQGIASLYHSLHSDLSLLRQPGDIDVYVDCGREKAIEYARSMQNEVNWDYKHLHLNIFKDTEVEMHYRPEILLDLCKNRKLQRWFERKEVQEQIFCKQGYLVAPSVEFNAFFILLHIYRHFLYEGVGLRQLMDWYFVLKSRNNDNVDDDDNLLSLIEQFGMKRFAKGVMWIMKSVFGLEDEYLICPCDEKEGRYILDVVMDGGNFGHHKAKVMLDGKGKYYTVLRVVRHNIHLITHYPKDALWPPVYFVWHKLWKLKHRNI